MKSFSCLPHLNLVAVITLSLASLFAALFTTYVSATETKTREETKESAEQLLAEPPLKWKGVYELNNGDTRLSDFIPENEKIESWLTKLSFEAHAKIIDIDPIAMMMGEVEKKNEICSNITHSNLFSGLENNYPSSVRLILCGENAHTKMGEVSMTKAIQGDDFIYIIRFEKKIPVFEDDKAMIAAQEIAEWSDYLKRVKLCNKDHQPEQENSHACPQK